MRHKGKTDFILCRYHIYVLWFVVYFMTLSQWLRLHSVEWRVERWMMNWSGVGRAQLWPNFKALSQHLPGAPEDRDSACEACFDLVTQCLLLPLLVGASLALRKIGTIISSHVPIYTVLLLSTCRQLCCKYCMSSSELTHAKSWKWN
jgi:hypothetical protein